MTSPHDLDRISPWHIDFSKLLGRRSKLKNSDLEYMHDIREALLAQATPASSAILYTILTLTVAAVLWTAFFKVDEVTQAEARVVPSNREQVINSQEGGLLAELLVNEGDVVRRGQVVARLEPTRFGSQYQEGLSKKHNLLAARARARAEALGVPLNFPPEVATNQQLVNNETQTYKARLKTLEESLAVLQKNQNLISKELLVSEKLAEQGLYSLVELSRLQRQENDLKQQIAERQNKFRADAHSELVRIDGELALLTPNLAARLDTLKRTELIAPVNGVVKNLRITTIGAAVPPSATILDIVPADAALFFEARLDPKDVSHVHPGLPVAIKLAAYDTAIYGELHGEVVLVSPDTFREDAKASEATQGGYYRVMIRSDVDKANQRQKNMQIIPGMTATTQIKTGEKTILMYLLKPLTKAKEAFRER
jgi:multidrug efflux pump subunit AcrA (membrane-fusion protein)